MKNGKAFRHLTASSSIIVNEFRIFNQERSQVTFANLISWKLVIEKECETLLSLSRDKHSFIFAFWGRIILINYYYEITICKPNSSGSLTLTSSGRCNVFLQVSSQIRRASSGILADRMWSVYICGTWKFSVEAEMMSSKSSIPLSR